MFVSLFISLLASCTYQSHPKWELFNIDSPASLRGISAVDRNVCWVGGSNSTLARTTDGGITWEHFQLEEEQDFEFRDIQAFGRDTVFVMSAGKGRRSKIYKTTDGGRTWKIIYQNEHKEGFFNGFEFWNGKECVLTGDPVEGELFVSITKDGGDTWKQITNLPEIENGEYGFAASGSHIDISGDNIWIGTGGRVARIFHSSDRGVTWDVRNTPMIQGAPSQGIFSIGFFKGFGVAVGGDYTQENEAVINNVIFSYNNGKDWETKNNVILPYRSSVKVIRNIIIVTGPSGTNVSSDQGESWIALKGKGFHTLDVGSDSSIWAAGSDGRVGKLMLN